MRSDPKWIRMMRELAIEGGAYYFIGTPIGEQDEVERKPA